jgi:hypothetical protein
VDSPGIHASRLSRWLTFLLVVALTSGLYLTFGPSPLGGRVAIVATFVFGAALAGAFDFWRTKRAGRSR